MNVTEFHSDHTLLGLEFEKIEDALEGEPAIKRRQTRYLPHPSQVDKESEESKQRYREYLAGAEYDNAADRTRRSMLGKMRIGDTTVKLPDDLDYLLHDVDGDGTELTSAIESSISEVLPFKFHCLVADYTGLQDLPLDSISIADLEAANPRAKVVQYSRPNIINWHFDRVNGQMQLKYLRLRQYRDEFNLHEGKLEQTLSDSYLILALDEDGNYYQQKEVDGETSSEEYIKVGDDNLKWIPVQFVTDAPMQKDRLPRSFGFLYSIIQKSLHLYIKTAQFDEHQRALCPTNSTSGWTQAKWDQFQKINERDYIARGGMAVNNYPEGITFATESPENSLESYFRKIEDLKKDIRMLGGESESSQSKMTATEAAMVSSNQNALLESIASSAENAWRRILSYCAMFEGMVQPADVEDDLEDIAVTLPRDFSKPKLTVEEVKALIELRMQRSISEKEMHRQLKNGGWMVEEVQAMVNELENEPSGMSLPKFVGENGDNLTDSTNQE